MICRNGAPFVDGANFEQVYRNERRAVLTIPPPRRALGSGFPPLSTLENIIPENLTCPPQLSHVAELVVVEVTMILHPIFWREPLIKDFGKTEKERTWPNRKKVKFQSKLSMPQAVLFIRDTL